MTNAEWLNKVEQNKHKLIKLIQTWHPNIEVRHDMNITAPGAELSCQIVRGEIRAKGSERKVIEEFETALVNENVNVIMNILNEVWFGVPESTSCWDIYGFEEAVNLLEDPPHDNQSYFGS